MRNYSGPSTVQGPHPGQHNTVPDDVSHFSKNERRMKLFFYTLLIMSACILNAASLCALCKKKQIQQIDGNPIKCPLHSMRWQDKEDLSPCGA